MTSPLLPATQVTLGVIGGGQLGRMFVHAAQALGFRTLVLDPGSSSPAGDVAHRQLTAAYTDPAALHELASTCAAVTTEFENVPAQSLGILAGAIRVAPSAAAVEICQDRIAEKQHFVEAGVPCAPFAVVDAGSDLSKPTLDALLPGILKTARLGYDGKGQVTVTSAEELAQAWARLGRVRCVLERRLPLSRELSVIVARGFDGQAVLLPLQQNLHRDGILAVTQVPAPDVPDAIARQAQTLAERLAASMDYVGVLCVEFFLLADGTLVANEMAPRPHNSGHYSIDACDVSQFELQVRTLAALPLVAPRQHSAAIMLNLLGELWFEAPGASPRTPDWNSVLALPGVHLHLYGKEQPRPGRKMGHLTVTAADAERARATALTACALLGLPAF